MLVKKVVVENKTTDQAKYFIVSGFVDAGLSDAFAFAELTQMSEMLRSAILDKDCHLEYKSDIVLFMEVDDEDNESEESKPVYH